jgi:hypothetical protein
MRSEFQKRDLYSFQLNNEQELAFFIENMGIT